MTLPFSDKPEKSRVYNDLKTLDLDELTQDQFDALRASMKSEGVNGLEDEYRRLVLLQMAGNIFPSGAPFGPLEIKQVTFTDAGEQVLLTPGVGEVWLITNFSQSSTYTGWSFGIMKIREETTFINCNIASTSGTGSREISLNEPQYVGYGQTLRIQVGGTGTGGSAVYQGTFIRVR